MSGLGSYSSSRKLRNHLMVGTIWTFSGIAILPLLFVFYYVVSKGIAGVNWDFFTALPAPFGEEGGGMGNAILGSLKMVGMAGLIAVPLGVLCGALLSEYRMSYLTKLVRFIVELLTSIPSIIVGLFIYTLVVVPLNSFSAWAGACALAFIMFPIVAKMTEEVLVLMPGHIREAGLALGIPRWKVITHIVIKGSLGAVVTGVVLAIARVAGETAPLLFTALGSQYWADSLLEPTASLPVQIYEYAKSPYESLHQFAWTGAFVLVFLVFLTNIFTRFLVRKAS